MIVQVHFAFLFGCGPPIIRVSVSYTLKLYFFLPTLTEDSEHVSKIVRKKLQRERVENVMKNGGQKVAIDLTLSDDMSNKVSPSLVIFVSRGGGGGGLGCGEGNLCKSVENLNFPISVHPVPGTLSFHFCRAHYFTKFPYFYVSHILTVLPLSSLFLPDFVLYSHLPALPTPFFIFPFISVLYGIRTPLLLFVSRF